jgi:hypothetical protein
MKTIILGKKRNPSTILKKEVINATEILVTWGGGMGGSNFTYYATELDNNGTTTFIKDIRGRELSLKNSFIVREEKVTIVKVVSDTTEHTNYREKKCNQSVYTQFNVVYSNEFWDLVDDIAKNNDRRVYSEEMVL